MGGGSQAKDHPWEYLAASLLSASINYPLWRASAVGQSGFKVTTVRPAAFSSLLAITPTSAVPYLHAFSPPYKGMCATILGMTWARAAIFWGSDVGRALLNEHYPEMNPTARMLLPPLVSSIGVQCINMPVVRASITIQNPSSELQSVRDAVRKIYADGGLRALWHGTSAGILKTVPKYCTAIVVRDFMEERLPPADPSSETYKTDRLWRSAFKSATAGVAGAALTNPLDVIRNEMFKTDRGFIDTIRLLHDELGWKFLVRGMGKNLVAVSIPVATTIFFTDALIQFTTSNDMAGSFAFTKRKNTIMMAATEGEGSRQ